MFVSYCTISYFFLNLFLNFFIHLLNLIKFLRHCIAMHESLSRNSTFDACPYFSFKHLSLLCKYLQYFTLCNSHSLAYKLFIFNCFAKKIIMQYFLHNWQRFVVRHFICAFFKYGYGIKEKKLLQHSCSIWFNGNGKRENNEH